MTTPDHIKRIIERLEPTDREALEQHLTGTVNQVRDLRAYQHQRDLEASEYRQHLSESSNTAAELSQKVEKLRQERDEYRGHLAQLCEMLGEMPNGKPDIGAAWEAVAAVIAKRDELAAQNDMLMAASWALKENPQDHEAWYQIKHVRSMEPPSCLAEVKAQTIESFAASVQRDSIHAPTLKVIAKHYANRIRQEAK